MVGVAQLVERLTVDQVAVGSSPITHPISSLKIKQDFIFELKASVVQLDRAIDFGSISWGFESLRAHIPDALLAQLAEHPTLNRMVGGSIPPRRTT